MLDYYEFVEGLEIEWLELNLLLYGRPLSKARILNLAGTDDEEIVDSWIADLSSRLDKYKEPIYTIINNIVTPSYDWKAIPEYYLCLYFAYHGAAHDLPGTKLFELVSADALKNYINGETYVLGFPANGSFNDYLDEISALTFEERGDKANGRYKDDGVDVVGYKTFGDKRSANMYVLQQCAAGYHWNKKRQIVFNRWRQYIKWYSESILLSISTVNYVPEQDWMDATSTYGIVFDRIRIYNYLYLSQVDTTIRGQILNWCQTKIDAL